MVSYVIIPLCVCVCILIYFSGAATSPSLCLEVCVSTTQVCIGVSFTTASFHFPFIASSGDPQEPHLFILATSVALSGHCCGVSALHLPEITWQSHHLATAVTCVSSDFWLSVEESLCEWWMLVQIGSSRKVPLFFGPEELTEIFHYVVYILDKWLSNSWKYWINRSANNKLDPEMQV